MSPPPDDGARRRAARVDLAGAAVVAAVFVATLLGRRPDHGDVGLQGALDLVGVLLPLVLLRPALGRAGAWIVTLVLLGDPRSYAGSAAPGALAALVTALSGVTALVARRGARHGGPLLIGATLLVAALGLAGGALAPAVALAADLADRVAWGLVVVPLAIATGVGRQLRAGRADPFRAAALVGLLALLALVGVDLATARWRAAIDAAAIVPLALLVANLFRAMLVRLPRPGLFLFLVGALLGSHAARQPVASAPAPPPAAGVAGVAWADGAFVARAAAALAEAGVVRDDVAAGRLQGFPCTWEGLALCPPDALASRLPADATRLGAGEAWAVTVAGDDVRVQRVEACARARLDDAGLVVENACVAPGRWITLALAVPTPQADAVRGVLADAGYHDAGAWTPPGATTTLLLHRVELGVVEGRPPLPLPGARLQGAILGVTYDARRAGLVSTR